MVEYILVLSVVGSVSYLPFSVLHTSFSTGDDSKANDLRKKASV